MSRRTLLGEIWAVCARHVDFWDEYSEGASDLAVGIMNIIRKYGKEPTVTES